MQEIVCAVLLSAGEPLDNATIHERVIAALDEETRLAFLGSEIGRRRLVERLASAKSNLRRAGRAQLLDDGRWVASAGQPNTGARRPTARRTGLLTAEWRRVGGYDEDASDPLFDNMTVAGLIGLYPRLLFELRRRGVIRSSNLVGEYAETLVAQALNARLAPLSHRSYDVISDTWGRIQVKARLVSDPGNNGQLQLGIIRGSARVDESVDHLAVVLFTRSMLVGRAVLIPAAIAESRLGPNVVHVNGRTLFATDGLMYHESVHDITEVLRMTAASTP